MSAYMIWARFVCTRCGKDTVVRVGIAERVACPVCTYWRAADQHRQEEKE